MEERAEVQPVQPRREDDKRLAELVRSKVAPATDELQRDKWVVAPVVLDADMRPGEEHDGRTDNVIRAVQPHGKLNETLVTLVSRRAFAVCSCIDGGSDVEHLSG